MMVIRPDSVPDNLEEQKIYIFTDNYLDNQRGAMILFFLVNIISKYE